MPIQKLELAMPRPRREMREAVAAVKDTLNEQNVF